MCAAPVVADNELVLDGWVHNAKLPRPIEAFVVSHSANDDFTKARSIHQAFLQRFGMSSDDVPLLYFDPNDSNQPFSLLRE